MSTSNIRLLKLINGDDLLVDVEKNGENFVKFKNALRVVVIPPRGPGQQPSVGLAPWTEFAEEKEMTLDLAHVLVMLTPIPEFVAQYHKIFSPIILPDKGLFVPQ